MIMMFITRKMSTPFRIVNICFFPGVRIDVRRAEHEVATGGRRGRGRRSGRHENEFKSTVQRKLDMTEEWWWVRVVKG